MAVVADPQQALIQAKRCHGGYRPEIDGLRAFAVTAVIINHFNRHLLPSGYLGVDLFFVISGYVITSSLSGRQSKDFGDFLGGFYERRIKRLVPALVVFVVLTSLMICLFNPDPGGSLTTGIKSLFGLSNLYLFEESADYFAQSIELNPFAHTWSLGVEEQFYLLFPCLIWFSGYGRQSQYGARNLFLAISVLSFASLIGFIVLYQVHQPAAYFLMPARFWEMAAGCMIFIGFRKRVKTERVLEKVPPLLVLTAMTAVMFLPISWAVQATISMVALAVVLIACLKSGTLAFAILSHKRTVYIGLISYSLYLWHWGVLSISRWTIGIHWWSVPLQAALIYMLGAGSHRFVESPFREGQWIVGRFANYVAGVVLVLASLVSIFAIEAKARFLYLGIIGTEPKGEERVLGMERCQKMGRSSLPRILEMCSLPQSSRGQHSVIAVGDSQMGHLMPLLNSLHRDHGTGVRFFMGSGISFPSLVESRSSGQNQMEFREEYSVSKGIFNLYLDRSTPGDIILLSSRYELRWGRYPVPLSQRQLRFTFYDEAGQVLPSGSAYLAWKSAFHRLIEDADRRGLKVVLLTSVPTFEDALDPSYATPQWFNRLSRSTLGHSYLPRKALKDHYSKVDDFLSRWRSNIGMSLSLTLLKCCAPRPSPAACRRAIGISGTCLGMVRSACIQRL